MSLELTTIRAVPHAQRGAVLFISMIMLVVLSLIGIASMQVTTLQERMAGNYYTLGRAFENAEGSVRLQETTIKSTIDAGGAYISNDDLCKSKYGTYTNAEDWANSKVATSGTATATRRIDRCIPGQSSLKTGQKLNEDTTSEYEIVSVNTDNTVTAANSASMVVIETVFIP